MFRLVVLSTVLLMSGLIAVAQNRSVYTSLEPKHCRTIKSSSAEAGDYEGRCRGAGGYSLIVTEGDLRQNVTVITPRGAKHSLELWGVISGGFSSVGPRAEWRMSKRNKPVALIIRYNASEDPAQPDKITSYLAVAKITGTEICVTDKVPPSRGANEDARRAADDAANKPCLTERN